MVKNSMYYDELKIYNSCSIRFKMNYLAYGTYLSIQSVDVKGETAY